MSQKTITRRGIRICQKDGQIMTMAGERWDVSSESKDGGWYHVPFARDVPTRECARHVRGWGAGASA